MIKYRCLIHAKFFFDLGNNRDIFKYMCSSSELNDIPQLPDSITNVES